jgi:hypothetical protein
MTEHNHFWTTGISVALTERGWIAYADFQQSNPDATNLVITQGKVETRFAEASLTDAIDRVIASLETLGVVFKPDGVDDAIWHGVGPFVWYQRDGHGPNADIGELDPPENWRELMNEQARRLGWECAYDTQTVP